MYFFVILGDYDKGFYGNNANKMVSIQLKLYNKITESQNERRRIPTSMNE